MIQITFYELYAQIAFQLTYTYNTCLCAFSLFFLEKHPAQAGIDPPRQREVCY